MTRDEIVTALRCHYDAIETGACPKDKCPSFGRPARYKCAGVVSGEAADLIEAQAKEIEKLRGQNGQLMSIIEDVTKAGKTWMCQYCAHCKGIVSGMADCDSKERCVMPYSQFELKRPEPPKEKT